MVSDFSEQKGERAQECRSQEADQAEAANRTELRRRPLHKDTVESPAKGGGERNGKAVERYAAVFPTRLKPKDANRAEQTQECADLKLPLANDPAFFGKKGQGEQSSDDDRRTGEDGIDARTHVGESKYLCDLMDNVWERWNKARPQEPQVNFGTVG